MNASEISEIIKKSSKVVPISGRTKPGSLCDMPNDATVIDLTELNGIVEYEPDEYTITAKAGTSIKTLITAVEANGQYLPFDPLFKDNGATLGGTIAANSSGSGRYRYGGIRDFILGVYFVDGMGNIVRGGGKVVKNASGFDLSKFMVGSLGRYGVLTEITMKVFPKPAEYRTLEVTFGSLEDALNCTFALANTPFEMDALDFRRVARDGRETNLWIRLGGLPESLPGRLDRLSSWLEQNTSAQTIIRKEFDGTLWNGLNDVEWGKEAKNLIKVPVSPRKLLTLDKCESINRAHYYGGGNAALVSADDLGGLTSTLNNLKLNGQLLRGDAKHPHLGNRGWVGLAQRVKQALDPDSKFLGV